jgi:hypothetical protein
MAMNDETYNVRFQAVAIIGRLGYYNPAHVMPSLRKTLIQLLTELEYTSLPYVLSCDAEYGRSPAVGKGEIRAQNS